MKSVLSAIVVIAFALTASQAIAGKRDEGLYMCQLYKDRMEELQDRQRHGGSASEMERWRHEEREYKDKFRNGNCSRHRADLD